MFSDIQFRDAIQHGLVVAEGSDSLDRRLQGASLDLRLSNDFLLYRGAYGKDIDPREDTTGDWSPEHVEDGDFYRLHPGQFVLASTIEWVGLGDSLVGWVEGKSSLGRLGLQVHSTAGIVDPGFAGQITLELSNVNKRPIRLYPGMPVCQILLGRLETRCEIPYGGKYNGQRGPRASEFHKNWNGSSW